MSLVSVKIFEEVVYCMIFVNENEWRKVGLQYSLIPGAANAVVNYNEENVTALIQ